jgi:CelD/BcsL family acetyltransferase involved in cellulose biosynthesis
VDESLSGFSIDLVEDRRGFAALAEEWRALFESSGRADQIFQRFDWLRLWADEFLGGTTKLAIVVGRRDSRLVMIWPLVETRSFGVTRLVFMGDPAGQYGDALIEEGEDVALLEAAWARILALEADIVHLRRVRQTSRLFLFLKERCLSAAPDEAPYVDFGGAARYEDFDKRYSGKARSSRRRLRRRLEEVGPVDFRRAAQGEEAHALVGAAFALKRVQLAERGRVAPTMRDERLERVFLAAARAPEIGAQVSAITCKGATIAVSVAFAAKGEAFGHILARDWRFEKNGLGVLLAEHAFRSAFEAGCKRFDMAPPADRYKLDWATGAVAVDDFASPLNVRGAIYARLWLKGGRAIAKAAAMRAPTWLLRATSGRG